MIKLKLNGRRGRRGKQWETAICTSKDLPGRTVRVTSKSKVMKFLGMGVGVMEAEDTFSGLSPQVIYR